MAENNLFVSTRRHRCIYRLETWALSAVYIPVMLVLDIDSLDRIVSPIPTGPSIQKSPQGQGGPDIPPSIANPRRRKLRIGEKLPRGSSVYEEK